MLKYAGLAFGHTGSPHEDMQRLLYYGGKNPKQLRVFLRRIFRRLEHPSGKRRDRLNHRIIEATWFDPLFRQKARAALLAHLQNTPLQRLVLALLIYDALTSEISFAKPSMHVETLTEEIKARGIELDQQALEKCLNELGQAGFIEKNPENTGYGLTSDGTEMILCEAMGSSDEELDKVIASAISELMLTSE